MRLGFVFTNFNNSRFTRELVFSIAASPNWGDSHVVIVDNSSERDDIEHLRRISADYPEIHLVLNDSNVGYFPGLNIGIKHLRSAVPDIEYVIVGNNDLFFPKCFAKELESKRELFGNYAVIAPDLVTLDGVHQNPHVIAKISKIREVVWDLYFSSYWLALLIQSASRITRKLTERKDYEEYRIGRTIYQGYGACYILGPLFFKECGELWAPTFLMGEEFFLSKQLESKGQAVYYEPSIRVQHHDHSTMGKVPSRRLWEIGRDSHKVYRKYVKVFSWFR